MGGENVDIEYLNFKKRKRKERKRQETEEWRSVITFEKYSI